VEEERKFHSSFLLLLLLPLPLKTIRVHTCHASCDDEMLAESARSRKGEEHYLAHTRIHAPLSFLPVCVCFPQVVLSPP
jgi:hypothetical protein